MCSYDLILFDQNGRLQQVVPVSNDNEIPEIGETILYWRDKYNITGTNESPNGKVSKLVMATLVSEKPKPKKRQGVSIEIGEKPVGINNYKKIYEFRLNKNEKQSI